MIMSEKSQRVVVIQLASRGVTTSAIKWALQGLSLEPGDELILVAIVRHGNCPIMFPFFPARKLLGLFETEPITDEEEVAKKKEEYHNNARIMKISEQCETEKILFRVEVLAGSFPEVAIKAATDLNATLMILERQMKKYKKYFLERLTCGILMMKHDDSIQHLRGPRGTLSGRDNARRCLRCPVSSSSEQNTESEFLSSRNSSTLNSSLTKEPQSQGRENPEIREIDMESGYGLFPIPNKGKGHTEMHLTRTPVEQQQHNNNYEAYQISEQFKISVCSICNNIRPKFGWKRDFTYAELQAATQGFSQKNFLSEGGFGSVYKGELDGMKIAVKQHTYASLQGEKEFKSEVYVLSKARHENVLMLLGSCSEGNNRLLVYEYVCNGSLEQHLSQYSRKPPSWPDRIKVAIGAAKGLLYLHENNIIHRDMRPNNILVTHDFEALVGDFGLARIKQEESMYSTDFVGTLGYLAPECAESGKVSTKADVYSFGVVLLQLITGMRTSDKRLGEKSLVGWARPLLKERNYPDLIDERMMDTHDCHELFWLIRLAEKCLSRDPRKRLTMATVVNALTHIVEGTTCSTVLKDCSPAQSDSSYAMSDSPKSEGNMLGSPESQCEDGSLHEESTQISSMNQMSFRLPPSPPMKSTYSSTSTLSIEPDDSTFDDLTNNDKREISKGFGFF